MTDEDDLYDLECGYFPNKKCKVEAYLLPPAEVCKSVVEEWGVTEEPWLKEAFGGSIPQKFYEDFYFSSLMENGFRRNGRYVYINRCPGCTKCVPIRLEVSDFVPSKSQRKAFARNQDIRVELVREPEKMVTEEKLALLKKYNFRHQSELSTGEETQDSYVKDELYDLNGVLESESGLGLSSSCTANMDYYLGNRLVAVGIVDIGFGCLSSVYFYYDTESDILKRSLGVFSVLKEIEYCLANGLRYYYLGLYLSDCRKMNYKAKYKPHQFLIDNEWVDADSYMDEHVSDPGFVEGYWNSQDSSDSENSLFLKDAEDAENEDVLDGEGPEKDSEM